MIDDVESGEEMEESVPVEGKPLPSQQEAFARLVDYAKTYFSNDWHDLSLTPRLSPLVVGPSGVGKSWLVRNLARTVKTSAGQEMPIIQLHMGEWMPNGARTGACGVCTMERVHRFLSINEETIIHIDELDKFMSMRADWTLCVVQELLSLLDRRVGASNGKEWTPNIRNRLKHKCFIVGSGTWQFLWDSKSLGFGSSQNPEPPNVHKQDSIPIELLRRFNERLLVLPYHNRADVVAIIQFLKEQCPAELLTGLESRIDEAVASCKGVRFFEEHITDRLIELNSVKQKNQYEFNF